MRPYTLHLCILAVLMIPGVALFILETLSAQTGGVIFRKYDAKTDYQVLQAINYIKSFQFYNKFKR